MKNKNAYKKEDDFAPGQGHTREQYGFAATLIAACVTGIFMIAVAVVLIKILKLIF